MILAEGCEGLTPGVFLRGRVLWSRQTPRGTSPSSFSHGRTLMPEQRTASPPSLISTCPGNPPATGGWGAGLVAVSRLGLLCFSSDWQLPKTPQPDPTSGRRTLNGLCHGKRNANTGAVRTRPPPAPQRFLTKDTRSQAQGQVAIPVSL